MSVGIVVAAWLGATVGPLPPSARAAESAGGESVAEAMCRLIDGAAAANDLPTAFLAKLIWKESRFKASAVSPVGAQGIAQFMPGTAAERGLADPFDPEQAIPQAARLLADLETRFGNLGLAAAAYNAGPNRVANWIAGSGGLPAETRDYVAAITGETAEHWAEEAGKDKAKQTPVDRSRTPCVEVLARLRRPDVQTAMLTPLAPWGVQLAGSFSKATALATFGRSRDRYRATLGDLQPMIIGTRLRSRGTRAFYRVRLPSDTRAHALQMCEKIHNQGGACIVLRT